MDKPKRYTVTPPPYIRSGERIPGMMLDVLIALAPALIVAAVIFGLRVLTLTAVSVASSVGCEWLWTKMRRRKSTVGDLSAVVTGVLLSFMLPAAVPLWLPAIGAAFAVIVVKELFGGLGKNLFNPAVGGYVFLLLSWPDYMTRFVSPQLLRKVPFPVFATPKVVPESVVHSSDAAIAGSITDWTHIGNNALFKWLLEERKPFWDLWDLLTGMREGALGETAVLALLAGCAYLIWRKVLKFRVTAGFVATVAVLSLIFPMGGDHYAHGYPATALFGGMLLLGAVFLATDPVTSPVTKGGQWVYGIGCGVLTEIIRHRGVWPDGVAFAILLMNALTWVLDKYLQPNEKMTELEGRLKARVGKLYAAVMYRMKEWLRVLCGRMAQKKAVPKKPEAAEEEIVREPAAEPDEIEDTMEEGAEIGETATMQEEDPLDVIQLSDDAEAVTEETENLPQEEMPSPEELVPEKTDGSQEG